LKSTGSSIPSGSVGGDLIDAIEAKGAVYAYVADVAGHGVGAGVLMSMVKTAVTDGLTEVFDSKDRELGDHYIERALTQLASLPIAKVADGIFESAKAYGKATDDQTLLLVRRRQLGPPAGGAR